MPTSEQTTKYPYPLTTLLQDLRERTAPYRGRFLLGSTLRLAGDLVWLYPPLALAQIINTLTDYSMSTSLTPVWVAVVGTAVATLVRYTCMYGAKQLVYGVSERTLIDTEMLGLDHLIHLDASWHERENAGNKLKRITRGAEGIDRILRIWVNNIIEIVVNFVGVTIIIATFDLLIAGLTLSFLVTFYILSRWFIVRAARASDAVNIQEEAVHGVLYESLSNIRTVQVLGMGHPLLALVRDTTAGLYEKILRRIFWYQSGSSVRHVWGHAFRLGVVIYIILGITEGRYDIGFLVLFITYFGGIWQSVAELSDVAQELVVAKYSVARMMYTLRTPARAEDDSERTPLSPDWQELCVDDVSFTYGSAQVLEHVSFKVRRGERVGLVGLSGAGKSTLFKLMLREREATSGTVTIDGVPLTQYRHDEYFGRVAAVLQDTEVFNLSLRRNITLANNNRVHDDALFERALAVSHVVDFLHKLPDGVETLIGEKGIKLSGGERQRVGIARAVFKQPDLLLMDEATSHLDVESEQKIQASLHELLRSVTAIVIAHRLSTVKEMDRIIVLEHGRIIEEGSFDELYARHGRFYELWEMQRL